MRVVESGDELVAIAAHRQTVAFPALGRQRRHHINLIATRSHVVSQRVAIRCPPLCAIADRLALDPIRGKYRARRRTADEARLFGALDYLARLGANAVGADRDVGLRRRAVLERQQNAVYSLPDSSEHVAVTDRARLERLLQQLMQISAVDVDERAAEARLAGFVEFQPVERLAGVPGRID